MSETVASDAGCVESTTRRIIRRALDMCMDNVDCIRFLAKHPDALRRLLKPREVKSTPQACIDLAVFEAAKRLAKMARRGVA